MDITLTPAEEAMLTDLLQEKETQSDVLHRLLEPMIAKFSEQRLQRMADIYRTLTPELQFEAGQVLREWQARKLAETVKTAVAQVQLDAK